MDNGPLLGSEENSNWLDEYYEIGVDYDENPDEMINLENQDG